MAKFEVGDRVRIKPDIDSHWGGMVAVVSSFYRGAAIVTVDNGSTLMYEVNDLEPTKSAIFQPGDIVRAKRGDHIVQNSVQDFGPEVNRELWLDDFRLTTWEEDGYTLTLVKRPEPEIVLPTKPGMYYATEDKYERGDEWNSDGKIFYYLNTDGIWIDLGWGQPSVIDGELKVYKNE